MGTPRDKDGGQAIIEDGWVVIRFHVDTLPLLVDVAQQEAGGSWCDDE